MPNIGVPEILIVAVVVLLLFGVGRIGKVGGELGKGIREFRTALREDDPAKSQAPAAAAPAPAVPATTEDKSQKQSA
jgi:sec-independent protein translocase protein TatA